jgi:hypothetical protein
MESGRIETEMVVEDGRTEESIIGAGGGIREHAIAQDESGHVGN